MSMTDFYETLRIDIDKALLAADGLICNTTDGKLGSLMFKNQIKPKNVGTNVKIVSSDEDSVTIAKFDEDGKILNNGFRILSSTDFHFGDDPKLRFKCMDMFYKHIRATSPDLVILTGDIIQSKYQHFDSIQFAEFMEEIGVYWAFVFGNHEAREEKGRFKHLLLSCQSRFPHCLARQGKKELFGLGNYCINILKSENEILKTLFLFDSGRDIIPKYAKEHGLPPDSKGYDFIKNNQQHWYENKLSELSRQYSSVKSFMYMHIPIKEYEQVICETEKDKWEYTDRAQVLYGNTYESIGSSPFNSGLFELIKALDSTQAIFSGHDHVNDFCAVYDGVYLVYNQCGGYETYTLEDKQGFSEKDWNQGVTITDIAQNGVFDISRRFNSMYL